MASKLVEMGHQLARERDATLYYHSAFMASTSLNTPMANQLQKGGLALELSGVAKNAADTKLVIEAMKLRLKEHYTLFFIVSGDVDYLDLLDGLAVEGAEALLLPLDEKRLTPQVLAVVKKTHGHYVRDLLELEVAAPPPLDEVALFTLLCQTEVHESGKLFFNKARDNFKGYFTGNDTPPDALWPAAVQQRFLKDREFIPGETRPVNRPAYENEKVLSLLTVTDLVLALIGQLDRRGGCSVQRVLALLDEVLPDSTAQEQHLEMMKRAKLIAFMGDQARLIASGMEDGITRPFLRVALVTWGQMKYRGWDEVPKGVIANRWAYQLQGHNKPIDPAVAQPIYTQALNFITVAQHTGLLTFQRNPEGRPAFKVRWEHPLAHETREAVTELLLLIRDFSAEKGYVQFDEFASELGDRGTQSRLLMPKANLEYFWLNALQAERHIKFSRDASGERRIRLLRSSRIVQDITGLRPEDASPAGEEDEQAA
jgi:hypothetical protein